MFSSPKSVKMMSSVSQNQMTSSFPSYAIWRRWTSSPKIYLDSQEDGRLGSIKFFGFITNFLVPSLPSPYKIQNGGREEVVRVKGFTSGIMAFQSRNARFFICLLRQYSANNVSFQVSRRSRRQVSPGNSWWGCAARFFRSWPNFRPKNVIFHARFQTRPLKSIPVWRLGL